MTVKELYDIYRIMPNLQKHQYRVAGVAAVLCAEHEHRVDRDAVISACLLHDMGNIIKFDLSYFPEFVEPEGIEYWQKIKDEFLEQYGKNPHHATLEIAKKVGASDRVCELIDAVLFNRAKKNWETTDFSQKICAYADMRVAPHGVVSLAERLEDGRKRYQDVGKSQTFSFVMSSYLKKIEEQLFEGVALTPEEITDDKVELFMAGLSQWQF